MRFALIALMTVALLGCSGEKAPPLPPTAPEPLPKQTPPEPPVPPAPAPPSREGRITFLWVVVIEEGQGFCVRDASIEIVAGRSAGQRIAQASDCSYWDPDYNAMFRELTADEELTLRVSAPGYDSKEVHVTPIAISQSALTIELARTR